MDETNRAIRFIHVEGTKLEKTFEQQVLDLLPRLRRFAIGLVGTPSDGDDEGDYPETVFAPLMSVIGARNGSNRTKVIT